MERELKKPRSSERPHRTPLAQRNRLSVKDRDPNYHYRLVNVNLENDPDRVERFEEAGYEIVPKNKAGQIGDAKVDTPSAVGSAGLISVGQGVKAVEMRIPKDYFIEDQAAKIEQIEATEQRSQKSGADYGEVKITSTRG